MSGGSLVGIVTDRDITLRCVAQGLPASVPVSELQTPCPVTIQGSADIFEAYRVAKDAGVRRLPVLEDADLAGIVTVDDLLIALVVELGAVTAPLAREVLRPDSSWRREALRDAGSACSPTARGIRGITRVVPAWVR